jgi:DNA polymerase III delta prime subunit
MNLSSNVNLDKRFLVYGDSNQSDNDDWTEEIIQKSGRIQLNTYQSFVVNLMNPQSDLRSLLLVHMTGTGKTITALATATEYVKQYESTQTNNSVSSIIVLGFTKDIFKKELLAHPEMGYVNMDEAKELENLKQASLNSSELYDRYKLLRNQLARRLTNKKVKGIYQFYGYRQFLLKLISFNDLKKNMIENNISRADNITDEEITSWIIQKKVNLDTAFIGSCARSLIICDECHNLYLGDSLNSYGLAVSLLYKYFYNDLTSNHPDYRSIKGLFLSATPLTASAQNIVPIMHLLTGDQYKAKDLFTNTGGIPILTINGEKIVKNTMANKVSFIMDDNPKEYPSQQFVGSVIKYDKKIPYLKFIRTTASSYQCKTYESYIKYGNKAIDGNLMIKDISYPPTPENLGGTFYSQNLKYLADLKEEYRVKKSEDGTWVSKIYHINETRMKNALNDTNKPWKIDDKHLDYYSSKFSQLIETLVKLRSVDHGKIFIYHPLVQYNGVELLYSILRSNGFVFYGERTSDNSICMNCNKRLIEHGTDHKFTQVAFTMMTGSLSQTTKDSRMKLYNDPSNLNGEVVKIMIGSKAMREGHTLIACRHVMIVHEPSSISEMIQILGRAVRKNVHNALPLEKRTVEIRIMTTSYEDKKYPQSSSIEEYAYYLKSVEYQQIDRINHVLYNASIDYLINFRFKMKEAPPIIGEPYTLDKSIFDPYMKDIQNFRQQTRNGISLTGIHTNMFNLFSFNSEVQLVIMIIKRIMLAYQPIIDIGSLTELIRNPPFDIEYDTQLISLESIAVAIDKIIFKPAQLRIINTSISSNFNAVIVKNLFDQNSILVDVIKDSIPIEYRLVATDDKFCNSTMIVKTKLSSLLENDFSILENYRKSYSVNRVGKINLRELYEKKSSMVSTDDIIDDLYESHNNKNIKVLIKSQQMQVLGLIAEWIINNDVRTIIHNKPSILSKYKGLFKWLKDYFIDNKLIYKITELKHTKIYDRLKKYDTTKYSDTYVAHMINEDIRILLPSTNTWIQLQNISTGLATHAYDFYLFEERIVNKTTIVLKYKSIKDKKSRGMAMKFMQQNDIINVAKKLGLDLNIKHKDKEQLCDEIEIAAWKIQNKIYPKRVIYKRFEIPQSI